MNATRTMRQMGLLDDIDQQVALKLWLAGDKVKNPGAWSKLVAFRLALDEIRRRKHEVYDPDSDPGRLAAVDPPRTEVDLLVRRALREMRPDQCLLVLRADLLGYNTNDLMDAYEATKSAVTTALSRARAAFRVIYTELAR